MAFYRKNIGGLHQAMRIALGVAVAGSIEDAGERLAFRLQFASVFPPIELAFAGLGDGERPQRVQRPHGAGV
ncbi:hypothetical protein [Bradyrhizobium sp. STM 3566]|uniref:hypothetical protein n=1 Tax=Bradyrhizobium sp. STM 3566 TaxID=578928 RepID=UPI00388E5288